ncbi:hypothetical protein Hanom_Chr04g00334981 [Helianthus anomalus]
MSLLDALKVPSMDVFDFDFEEQGEEDVPLMKQVVSSAQAIRPPTDPNVTEPSAAETTSSIPQSVSEQAAIEAASFIPVSSKDVGGSSGSQVGKKSILDDVDGDPEVLYRR